MATLSPDDVNVNVGGEAPEAVPDEVAEMFALDKKKKKKKPKKVCMFLHLPSAPHYSRMPDSMQCLMLHTSVSLAFRDLIVVIFIHPTSSLTHRRKLEPPKSPPSLPAATTNPCRDI